MRPVLLIPVFRGGDLLKECLLSVQGKEHFFDRIVVSLNGDEAGRARDREILSRAPLQSSNLFVFETGRPLHPVDHQAFVLNRVQAMGLDRETPIMNLFHDDWLLRGPEGVSLGSVVLGDWERTRGASPVTGVSGPSQDVAAWLQDSGRKPVFLNGSGMIAPLGVMQDVAKILRFFRTGVRYEHLLLTHHRVRTVDKVEPALVRIRIHDQQAGSNQTAFECLRGDLAFVAWLLIQGRVTSLRSLRYLLGAFITGFQSFAIRLGHNLRARRQTRS